MSAGVPVWCCAHCGAGFYPHPLLCPRCGSAEGKPTAVYEGRLEEATVVHRAVGAPDGAPPRQLATIALPGGQRLVAALEGRPEVGARVVLRESDGAVLATRRTARGPRPARSVV
jgi:uncharacterized OB-fold protein